MPNSIETIEATRMSAASIVAVARSVMTLLRWVTTNVGRADVWPKEIPTGTYSPQESLATRRGVTVTGGLHRHRCLRSVTIVPAHCQAQRYASGIRRREAGE